MKVKVDENLPVEIAVVLRRAGVDADTTLEEGLRGRPDEEVWAAACREGRTLVTQDVGLVDARNLETGSHPGMVLMRLKSDARQDLIDAAVSLMLATKDDDWSNTIAVVTEQKLRVRRSGKPGSTSEG